MTNIATYLDEINRLKADYQPAADIVEQLGQTTFVPLIGAFAVGKTATMRAVSRIDPEFSQIRGITTRSPRPGETDHDFIFLNHDQPSLAKLIAEIRLGRLVQFTVHPTTGDVYGTTKEAYEHPYSMLAMLPGVIAQNILDMFQAVDAIAMVTSPDEWLERIEMRAETSPSEDVRKRLKEGITNLEWCLAQESGLNWIDNSNRKIEDTAAELISVVKYGQRTDPEVKVVGRKLLSTMKSLLATD